MNNEELYSIGDAARRSGLSVSTVRFYSDAGVIEPTDLTESGHRLYDVHAIARLELVRTLRELDTGLDKIRRLLDGGTTLHDLLTTHLRVVEQQEHTLRARQAVLRTLIKQEGTSEQTILMNKLVSMSDEERERTIDDFWNEVSEGLDVPEGFIDRLRAVRPHLPEDPTAAQLEAWIELADLVREREFRDAVRTYLGDTYSTSPGRVMATAPIQDFIHTSGARIGEDLVAVCRAGEPPESPRAQEFVARLVEATAALSGERATAESRERLAAAFLFLEERLSEEEGQDALEDAQFDGTHGRYLSLVAVINGTTPEEDDLAPYVSWIAAALRVPVPET